jgi:hypothetical protein
MDSISELEFKVQILARCMGSALGLGRPTRVQIHYCDPQSSTGDKSEPQISSLGSEGKGGSQGQEGFVPLIQSHKRQAATTAVCVA